MLSELLSNAERFARSAHLLSPLSRLVAGPGVGDVVWLGCGVLLSPAPGVLLLSDDDGVPLLVSDDAGVGLGALLSGALLSSLLSGVLLSVLPGVLDSVSARRQRLHGAKRNFTCQRRGTARTSRHLRRSPRRRTRRLAKRRGTRSPLSRSRAQ